MIVKKRKELNLEETKKILKDKKLLFAMWDCENKTAWPYQSGYLPIKDFFKDVILFDPRKKRFEYGGERMRKMFLDIVEQEKPDYILCMVGSDEINIDIIEEINKISPKTKIISHFGDDDIDFDIFSRFYILFVDYGLVFEKHYLPAYEKDEIKNRTSFVGGANLKLFKPLKLKKEYDVSFIGAPLPSRIKLMRFLLDKGTKIELWGKGWDKYPEFKDIYHGPASDDEYVRIVNRSKINLSFSRNKYGELHLKGRPFEIGACKSFQLVDYYPEYFSFFKENKEIVMFKDNNDLLRKIEYYFKSEREREKIAENMYKKVIKNYDLALKYLELFKRTLEYDIIDRKLPEQKKKIIEIKKDELSDIESLKNKVEDYDYVSFSDGNCIKHRYKEYLQIYAMEKTEKVISCCSYYLCSRLLGNYMSFRVFPAWKNLEREQFYGLLNINQIAVSKEYFIRNIDKFKDIFSGKIIDFINEKNTAFIAIPLVQIKSNRNIKNAIKKIGVENIKKAFQLGFAVKLYSLAKQKKVFSSFYSYKLGIWALFSWNLFLLKYLFKFVRDKENLNKLKNYTLQLFI